MLPNKFKKCSFIVFIFLYFIVSASAKTNSYASQYKQQPSENFKPECHSFYDYVCQPTPIDNKQTNYKTMDEESTKQQATSSYFEILHKNHFKITEHIFNDHMKDILEKCSLISSEHVVSALEQLVTKGDVESFTYHGNSSLHDYSEPTYDSENKFTQNEDHNLSKYEIEHLSTGFNAYHQIWLVNKLKRNNFGSSFPIKIQIVKKLDSVEPCIELSPDVSWLNKVKAITDSEEFNDIFEKPDTSKVNRDLKYLFKRTLKDLINALIHSYTIITEEEEEKLMGNVKEYNILDDFVNSYETLETLGKSSSDYETDSEKKSRIFLKNVIYTLYDLKDDSVCIQTNGYEKFYHTINKFIKLKFTEEYDFTYLFDAFDHDISFDKYNILSNAYVDILTHSGKIKNNDNDENDVKEIVKQFKHEQCKKLVKQILPRTFNDHFLRESGALEAYMHDDSIEQMVYELKYSISNIIGNSSSIPFEFKRYAMDKMNNLKLFVLNKMGNLDEESKEKPCFFDSYGNPNLLWEDIMDCLSERRLEIEKNNLRNTLDISHSDRYNYIYESTDISTVNAWYDPTRNEITIPVGIIFWPMYSGNSFGTNNMYDYSRMGMILAHELGHALDSNGLCWDSKGNYDISKKFCSEDKLPKIVKSKMECLMNDYGHPCDEKDQYGERTLGEDMADQFGIRAAWDVFDQKYYYSLRLEDKRDFFRKYALLWCDGKHYKNEEQRSSKISHVLIMDDKNSFVLEQINDHMDSKYANSNDMNKYYPFKLKQYELSKNYYYESTMGTTLKRKQNNSNNTSDYKKWMCDKVMNDVHALPKHRVNKTLRQFKVFADIFECKNNAPMINQSPCMVF